MITDSRFEVNGDRKEREDELAALLEETLTQQTTDYWIGLFEEAGVVAGPIYNMEQVYQDPQVQARDMLVKLEDPELGTLHNIGIPVKLSKTPGRIRRRAPAWESTAWKSSASLTCPKTILTACWRLGW